MFYVMDEDGNVYPEPDTNKWAETFQLTKTVRFDKQGDVSVSTVFLGVDHGFGNDRPILFETMVFGGRHDQSQRRYHTRDEAIAGHLETCRMVWPNFMEEVPWESVEHDIGIVFRKEDKS